MARAAAERGGAEGGDGPGPGLRSGARPAATLVVVESPAKGKTLLRLLGPGHAVHATQGHLRDLPETGLGIDPENDFAPTYQPVKGKAKLLSDLKRAARGAGRVLLATDPDREGEAIAWHLSEELGAPGGDARVRRVDLRELTPAGVSAALAQPRDVDRRRHDAQQARRVLDRLVGFQVSELLWSRVKRGISAGRVQSVAVRLVVEREKAIEAFRPQGSWAVEARLATAGGGELIARVARPGGPGDGEAARKLAEELGRSAFRVARMERRERSIPAPAPFTTARLQEEAAARLGFSARKTMAVAQRLFEGVALGEEGRVGLISYMRTDSTHLSASAVAAARAFVAARFGEDHLPASPNVFRTRAGAAQEAHEAVRPTAVDWTPERVRPFLSGAGGRDLHRLYELVWSRFVSCQMAPAVVEETEVEVEAVSAGEDPRPLRAGGTALRFPGWTAVAGARPLAGPQPGEDPRPEDPLPPLEVHMPLRVVAVTHEQRFSRPPARFTEGTLVREMEERGLGRPSTYASVVETIQERAYVVRQERSLRPTALGRTVTDYLVDALPRVMDVAFTAGVEARLDQVEEGTIRWQEVVAEFHAPFHEELERAGRAERPPPSGHRCPRCGRPLALRFGRNGEFFACTGYPACRHTANPVQGPHGSVEPEGEEDAPVEDPCPECGAAMVRKRGRFGRFLACSRYPACRGARSVSIGLACPKGCGGSVTERRSRAGRAFFGCTSYPACDFVSWDRPRDGTCPDCGSAWLVDRAARSGGTYTACPNRECGYRGGVPGSP
jgi:DNA topoisomerase-1